MAPAPRTYTGLRNCSFCVGRTRHDTPPLCPSRAGCRSALAQLGPALSEVCLKLPRLSELQTSAMPWSPDVTADQLKAPLCVAAGLRRVHKRERAVACTSSCAGAASRISQPRNAALCRHGRFPHSPAAVRRAVRRAAPGGELRWLRAHWRRQRRREKVPRVHSSHRRRQSARAPPRGPCVSSCPPSSLPPSLARVRPHSPLC